NHPLTQMEQDIWIPIAIEVAINAGHTEVADPRLHLPPLDELPVLVRDQDHVGIQLIDRPGEREQLVVAVLVEISRQDLRDRQPPDVEVSPHHALLRVAELRGIDDPIPAPFGQRLAHVGRWFATVARGRARRRGNRRPERHVVIVPARTPARQRQARGQREATARAKKSGARAAHSVANLPYPPTQVNREFVIIFVCYRARFGQWADAVARTPRATTSSDLIAIASPSFAPIGVGTLEVRAWSAKRRPCSREARLPPAPDRAARPRTRWRARGRGLRAGPAGARDRP